MEVVEILRKRDVERAVGMLREIHRQKTYALARSALGESAKLHAHHIALLSIAMPEVEVVEDSITGVDYRLAKLFRESVEKCVGLPADGDDFYSSVVRELNSLVDFLCSSLNVANSR